MAGKPKKNMVPHLIKCIYVDPATRACAQAAKDEATAIEHSAVPWRLSHLASWSQPSNLHPQCMLLNMWSSTSHTSTLSPLPSPLLLSTLIFAEPPLKCKCASSTFEDSPLSGRPLWTPALQSEFGKDLCKLLIAIRAPWNAANNPQMQLFVQKWVPGAVVPD